MNKIAGIIFALLLLLTIFLGVSYYNVAQKYGESVEQYNDLVKRWGSYSEFRNEVFRNAEDNCTAITIEYYTNFSQNQQILSFSVPHETYDDYNRRDHPIWSKQNLTSAIEYISANETIIKQIVEVIRNQTNSEEELADALLNFVQDKRHSLSIRYYPTAELKYPIETLVEMGGDCDTHSFLYATLMKAAGFKVLVLLSNNTLSDGQLHAATAVRLTNSPQNSLSGYEDYSLTYEGEKYYYAETTYTDWRVGDLPPWAENLDFNPVSV